MTPMAFGGMALIIVAGVSATLLSGRTPARSDSPSEF